MLTSHPKRTLLAVLGFVIIAGVFGTPVAGKLSSDGGFVAPGADSQVAIDRIEHATGVEASPGIVLLTSPAARDGARDRLARIPGVVDTQTPSPRLVTATLATSASDDDVAGAALDAFHGRSDVTVGGAAVADMQIGDTIGSDLGRAELFAFPVLFLLSLVFFRGRAALMPLVVGTTTVLGTFLLMSAVNGVYGMHEAALNLVTGLGLGLAIDYTLFLVTRFREELARGTADPVRVTMRRAGHTVAFSAATVAGALITLTVFPQGFLKSMGIAGALVAVVAAASALIVSPALFALWGPKLARPSGDGSRWHRLAHAVMRRPGRVAAVTAAVMVLVALPSLSASWTPIDSNAIPEGMSSRTVADAVGAEDSPITVVAGTPGDLAARISHVDGVAAVSAPRELAAGVWQIDATATGNPAGPSAQRAVRSIRALGDVHVGGPAAEFVDQQAAIGARLPIAIALLVTITMLVLFAMTRSVILPVKAVLMNALTVGAALAPLTLIYGGVEPTDFLVTAAIVFALSTDYGVFLLGRIKEERDAGRSDREAVAAGLAGTGRVVTAAAILLAVAIGAFATSSISFIQQIGVATATGVLIDAFVVRTLLVPSLMALLGEWNWWAPRRRCAREVATVR